MSKDTLPVDLAGGGDVTAAFKARLAKAEAKLKRQHLGYAGSGAHIRSGGIQVCRSYTALIDSLLSGLYRFKAAEAGCKDKTALVAVGGYGRGELNLRSDIDLTLVYKSRLTPAIEELTQQMLYVLWDTGLDLGFSIRSVDECISLAREDLKTQTALLDLRYIDGCREMHDDLAAKVRKKLFGPKSSRKFITEKIDENRSRQAKYGGSVYILEPNLKEGGGGLRDFHTAMWVSKAATEKHLGPFSMDLVKKRDRSEIRSSLSFLLWVRNELHFETLRKNDQLTFDQQERIAKLLGFEKTETALAVEHFMQHYYRHATTINHYSELILSRSLIKAEQKHFLWPKKRTRIDDNYSLVDTMVSLVKKDAFDRDPGALIKAFEHSQHYGVRIEQSTRDLMLEFIDRAEPGLGGSTEVSESFLKILSSRDKSVFDVLNEMHSLKFLSKYIPEFSAIRCKVQHDRYHVYTVDVHTLFAVRELERLRNEYKPEFVLQSTIFEELEKPEVLILAVLFHDIGKAHGKGHAQKGADIVPAICERLNLDEDDTNTIRFLVKNHLLLADTAQYRDLHDEKLVVDFARQVGDIERLNMLFLLTFADVRAVGPDVWSQWKGALFQELYFKALTVLERGSFEAEDAGVKISRVKSAVLKLLASEGFTGQKVDEYFEVMPGRYFLANAPELISGHIKLLNGLERSPYIMKVRQDSYREYTELTIATHDIHGLFSMITGVMAANGVNILGAQIYTLKDGTVLDILQVNTPYGEFITEESKLENIEKNLADVLTGKIKVARLVGERKPSILDKKARPKVSTSVQVDNEVSDEYTVLDIHTHNRVGLLYDITSTLTALGVYIFISKITTKGDAAADIFYVKDIFGQKIYYKEKLKEIIETVYDILVEKTPTQPTL